MKLGAHHGAHSSARSGKLKNEEGWGKQQQQKAALRGRGAPCATGKSADLLGPVAYNRRARVRGGACGPRAADEKSKTRARNEKARGWPTARSRIKCEAREPSPTVPSYPRLKKNVPKTWDEWRLPALHGASSRSWKRSRRISTSKWWQGVYETQA
ncbi:hypothetical protein C8J57DRAFT_1469998 [Mycena rebaudengoi]|nr:hypothetical protein C8J57DRAFT_1469998 [Mycena rebaudengoi]